MENKTSKFWVAHNIYSHALPEIISQKGNRLTFYPEKLNIELWEKIEGRIGCIDLTISEAKDIFNAKRSIKVVPNHVLVNVGLINECDLYPGNMGEESSAPLLSFFHTLVSL